MLTYVYFGLLGLACLISLGNWRAGIYAAILLDFVRDPVRKLDPDEPVLVTVSLLGLWGVITLSAWNQEHWRVREFLRDNPRVFAAFQWLVIAILPGIVMSMLLYSQGYLLVALGTVSYLAPSAGVVIGLLYAQHPQEITRLLRFYCLVNGIALTGVIAEYVGMNWSALGGMRGMQWIRYSGGDTVNLVAGFYRSPDIMGLHAAQLVMFSMVLTAQSRRGWSPGWLLLAAFGSLCLLLSGRRKMLGMPLVFIAVFAALCHWRGMRRFHYIAVPIAALGVAAGGIYLVATEEFVADEYTNFAGTLVTEGATRSQEIWGGSIASTLNQSGVMGAGIGSATQGAYHVRGSAPRERGQGGWQEDGVSRLFLELGVPGVIFVLASGLTLLGALRDAIFQIDRNSPLAYLQLMLLAVVAGNLASFAISHQHYSGDPPSALIVLMVLGMALAVPRMVEEREERGAGSV